MIIDNHFDATLVQILSSLCTRRDIAHTSEDMAHTPFEHVLGTLARSTVANAIRKDGRSMKKFQIGDALAKHYSGSKLVEDHVFPIDQWKSRLIDAARERQWKLDKDGLQGMRDFFDDHYVTAIIPEALHHVLSPYKMPDEWTYSGFESLWARYRTNKVRNFIGRDLILPTKDAGSTDFILLAAKQMNGQ